MSDLITGVHLQAEGLSADIIQEIDRIATWVVTAKFEAISADLEKCLDNAREERLSPLLSALGIGNKV
jgi:hypothetical protein